MDQLVGIHHVTVFKQTGSNYLLVRVVLMDDLFEEHLTKYERLVRIEFIKMFSSKDPHKSFNIKQFFIYLIKIFQQYQLIEDEGLLIKNGSTINIHST